ncbi:unnamed protein product [Phyllotreta striolata]|uniref:Uncharacterized protein n=1 Tax=Phyllotreta striolata TaxID=444603 RepID=A0A9N9THA6_PHYSR|nr:unnamed protein product [Phyllotreta striolata]
MSTEVNLKQGLRKLEYPICAKEALYKIYDLICSRITSIKNMDLALDLMAEFVFYEVDRRGHKRAQSLSPLQELQLVKILYEYFDTLTSESGRNTVFLSLFSGTTINSRLGVLTKFISMGIGIPSTKILSSASAWMQQLGNTSPNSCKFAEGLIQDYFHFYVSSTEKITALPEISLEFTANFLTAIAENYYNTSNKKTTTLPPSKFIFPPQKLLETVTLWISQNTSLCIAAQQKQAVLPPGAIAMEATTPIAGLLKWCILAPIYRQDSKEYTDLHLALLNSIMEIPKSTPPKAVCAQHLTSSINPILTFVNDLKNKQEKKFSEIINEDALQLSLDRFAQAIQVIASVNAMYGHTDDLYHQIKILPFNKLMNIIQNNYKNKVVVL